MARKGLEESKQMLKKPKLIIVTGMVATGKTTLAKKLGTELSMPVFCRDELKELGFDVLGSKDREWSQQLGGLSYELLYLITERLLSAGLSVIIESPFPPERLAKKIQDFQGKYEFDCVQVRIFAEPDVLFDRFKTRINSGERHAGHVDSTILDETKKAIFAGNGTIRKVPINCPFVDVDTTDFTKINYTEIINLIKKS